MANYAPSQNCCSFSKLYETSTSKSMFTAGKVVEGGGWQKERKEKNGERQRRVQI
jgi:hypothetical protein